MSVLDFDIPFAYVYTMSNALELLGIIGIMASVTWEVLIVGIIAIIGSKYAQVRFLLVQLSSPAPKLTKMVIFYDFFVLGGGR